MDGGGGGGAHAEDRKDPSQAEGNRSEFVRDAAQQNAEADNRQAAGIDSGALSLPLFE
jgi:hypothetical protein